VGSAHPSLGDYAVPIPPIRRLILDALERSGNRKFLEGVVGKMVFDLDIMRFTHRYTVFNGNFAGGVAALTGLVHIKQLLFRDPAESIEACADRSAEIASQVFFAAEAGHPAYFDTYVSSAVRVCAAAAEAGLDLSGTFFRLGSEPFTPARAEYIAHAGARAACHYAMAETGTIGFGCAEPNAVDDVHLLLGKYALLTRDHRPGDPIDRPGAVYLTSLRYSSAKILLNLETGDCAQRTHRRCGCPLGELGFDVHLHAIRSVDKFVSEGMHFLETQLLELLEEVLPQRFGGAPTDYQLVEEDRDGLPVVMLRVHPRVGPLDESRVVAAALDFLAAGGPGLRLQREIWSQAGTLRVERLAPLASPASKVFPIVSWVDHQGRAGHRR
jgi:hypothetical protein